jgi:hypothetical protein
VHGLRDPFGFLSRYAGAVGGLGSTHVFPLGPVDDLGDALDCAVNAPVDRSRGVPDDETKRVAFGDGACRPLRLAYRLAALLE